MDDLAATLANILNDPESRKMLSDLAASLPGLTGGDAQEQTPPPAVPAPSPSLSLPGGEDLAMLMKIGNLLQSKQEDDRTRLLQALRPLLTPARQTRVDKAIRLLRLAELLPLLKEAGFSLF